LTRFAEAWEGTSNAAASEWHFSDCNLLPGELACFFHAFQKYPSGITYLTFHKCQIGRPAIEALSQEIATAACFHGLIDLSFAGCNSPEFGAAIGEYFLKPEIFADRPMTFLDVVDCNVAVDGVLSALCALQNSVWSLSLSGDRIASPDGFGGIAGFGELEELTLSRVECTGAGLLGLFRALSQAPRAPSTLVLDGLKLTDPGPFFGSVGVLEITALTQLSFNNIEVTDAHFADLCTFIHRQPCLASLGLGGTIASPAGVAELIALVKNADLVALDLACTKQPLGNHLVPLFGALIERKTVRALDVTGQAVADAGMRDLATLAELCLEDLRCDGSEPASHDSLLGVLSRLVVSGLQRCEWPRRDVIAVMEKVPIWQRKGLKDLLCVLERTFDLRFGTAGEAPRALHRTGNLGGKPQPREKNALQPGRPGTPGAERRLLSFREGIVRSGLGAIFDESQITEPLLESLDRIESNLAVD
jgi:hypothetical protein